MTTNDQFIKQAREFRKTATLKVSTAKALLDKAAIQRTGAAAWERFNTDLEAEVERRFRTLPSSSNQSKRSLRDQISNEWGRQQRELQDTIRREARKLRSDIKTHQAEARALHERAKKEARGLRFPTPELTETEKHTSSLLGSPLVLELRRLNLRYEADDVRRAWSRATPQARLARFQEAAAGSGPDAQLETWVLHELLQGDVMELKNHEWTTPQAMTGEQRIAAAQKRLASAKNIEQVIDETLSARVPPDVLQQEAADEAAFIEMDKSAMMTGLLIDQIAENGRPMSHPVAAA